MFTNRAVMNGNARYKAKKLLFLLFTQLSIYIQNLSFK